MKRKLTLLFVAVLAIASLAATSADWVQGPTLLWRYQSDPTFEKDTTTLATAPVTAFFGYWLTNVSTGEAAYIQAGAANFDMVALGKETVTSGKVTVTYAELAALNGQAALDQYNAQQAAAKAAKAGP